MEAKHPDPARRRRPGVAKREELPADEWPQYDRLLELVRRGRESSLPRTADGTAYGVPLWEAATNSPRVFGALFFQLYAALDEQLGQTYRLDDRELANIVLGTDAGYWVFHAGHTANALAAGVRRNALTALAEQRDDLLSKDEMLVVSFVRAVRDLRMTDELWQAMVDRLGSLRGAIDFAVLITYLRTLQSLMSCFDIFPLSGASWYQLMAQYENGSRTAIDDAATYVRRMLDPE
jgi:hypothetical protein